MTGKAARILVVDDDPMVSEVVARYLEREGHVVECANDGAEALSRALADPPDLLVLDLTLSGTDGLQLCGRLREYDRERGREPAPVIMLTALGEEIDRVVGLETGADDYITKPFSPRELALRVQAVLRRTRGSAVPVGTGVLADGDLVVDVGSHEVRLAGKEIGLTAREFDLLAHLIRNPRQVFSRSALLDQVWGWSFGDSSTVTVHVRRLREKIEADPADPRRIVTVWGVGYRYEPVR
ncbi:response regulator transcription factor [Microtetraspora sp. NBRC 16547]|uniref:response regulator transcription factor n=1 Tax=Microtetraspora sp. NBRC 16547 TaxID=3030993 RepID=UPI00249FAD1C|nr:response regulator transcription factor [Microtetraspora sp. NBRC 16547]GLX02218.1 DNA-binding response regulator [Microtetraspora sp. NBRC 16547]